MPDSCCPVNSLKTVTCEFSKHSGSWRKVEDERRRCTAQNSGLSILRQMCTHQLSLQEWHAGGCHVNQAVNQDGHKCHPNTVDLDTGGPRDQAVTCMQSDCEVSLGWVKTLFKRTKQQEQKYACLMRPLSNIIHKYVYRRIVIMSLQIS